MESSALHYFFSPGQGLLFCILITKQKNNNNRMFYFGLMCPFHPWHE